MCIISFHLQNHPKYKLILIANRDEAYERPTAPLHFWDDEPNILAGRDLKANGTWLGVTKQGRIAALTNYRDPNQEMPDQQSRGDIIRSFLTSKQAPDVFLHKLQANRQQYNGFNLLVGTVNQLYYYSKQLNEMTALSPGTYSVSNAALDTPWPKVKRAREQLHNYVTNNYNLEVETLFNQLVDDEKAIDTDLPDTGVGLPLEKQLSPIFIRTEHYGTRSSTVLLVTHDNQVEITERTFLKGVFDKDTHYAFQIKTD